MIFTVEFSQYYFLFDYVVYVTMSMIRKITYKKLQRYTGSVWMACSTDTGGIASTIRESTTQAATIYALSSGPGKCGVAVIRISGDRASEALKKMTKMSELKPRKAFLKKIYDPITREVIDKGLCLWFPGPNSFTGEDSVEFQVHGGSAILEALTTALSKLKFQPAMPGEFTKRAFYNGKLDLTEIEGLADLIHAETEQQRRQALLQADGSLSKLYNNWRNDLLKCLAHLEAYIDFSENDNIEDGILENCNNEIKKLSNNILQHLSDGRRGEILRNGIRTVIIGQPNVGKSSLLNHLVHRNAVIVTPIAGTTRDIVELNTNISGYPVILADTAGLAESTQDIVEQEGIRRAKVYAKNADIIILMIDASVYRVSGKSFKDYLNDYVKMLDMNELLIDNGGTFSKSCIIVVNKIDLIDNNDYIMTELKNFGAIMISCAKESKFPNLMNELRAKFLDICGNPSRENPTISQTRHRIHLINCSDYLQIYLEMCQLSEYDMVIAGQQIRNAMRELGKITGHVNTDEILDTIFTNFCIGK